MGSLGYIGLLEGFYKVYVYIYIYNNNNNNNNNYIYIYIQTFYRAPITLTTHLKMS